MILSEHLLYPGRTGLVNSTELGLCQPPSHCIGPVVADVADGNISKILSLSLVNFKKQNWSIDYYGRLSV